MLSENYALLRQSRRGALEKNGNEAAIISGGNPNIGICKLRLEKAYKRLQRMFFRLGYRKNRIEKSKPPLRTRMELESA